MKEESGYGSLLLGLLTILFIGLKLTGTISWSWFWVLSPILIPKGFAILVLIIIIAFEKLEEENILN
ncbi:hypothetical protein [Anaerococcus tetradius]|uniref:hypothetical protein n=1 Tax=Anaerococcus tetradius TaxID=33036 RepID=UPI0023F2EC06|nr:hypothetical protein [Anaerococcus tetradius]